MLRFEYDSLDRLTLVVTPSGQRLEYHYASGEPSLVTQHGGYAEAVVTPRRDSGLTFSASWEVFATRADWLQYGSVRFDEKLGRFQLSGSSGYEISTRAGEGEGPLARLRLVADGTPLHERQRAFQAPSNPMYLPAEYAAINCCPICAYGPDHPPCEPCYEDPPEPDPPYVIIESFSSNPILLGSTASVQVSVSPPATVALTISSSGTGRAKFVSTGNTTMQISGTTTVSIRGDAASTAGAIDLSLSATQGSTLLATADFTVTTGACTAAYTGHIGGGLKNCPAQVQLRDRYNIANYCDACQFSCIAASYDNTFTPGPCLPVTSGIVGSGNQSLESTLNGTFNASDCNWHNVQIRTLVINAQSTSTNYNGGSIGLRCNSLPNGSPCP